MHLRADHGHGHERKKWDYGKKSDAKADAKSDGKADAKSDGKLQFFFLSAEAARSSSCNRDRGWSLVPESRPDTNSSIRLHTPTLGSVPLSNRHLPWHSTLPLALLHMALSLFFCLCCQLAFFFLVNKVSEQNNFFRNAATTNAAFCTCVGWFST
jgi:hypothetical protein